MVEELTLMGIADGNSYTLFFNLLTYMKSSSSRQVPKCLLYW